MARRGELINGENHTRVQTPNEYECKHPLHIWRNTTKGREAKATNRLIWHIHPKK